MKFFEPIINFLISFFQDSTLIRQEQAELEAVQIASCAAIGNNKKYIICNGKPVFIDWDKVITHQEVEGLQLPENCYKKVKNIRSPQMLVAHWDVCLSSKSCFKILKNRHLSVHFLIDNDGTIYQLMDCKDIGYHAGNRKVNNNSVGVEISNAYNVRYQEVYKQKGFGERPILTDSRVHGRTLKPYLGFYPVQVEAFKKLAIALNSIYHIPLKSPLTTTVDSIVSSGQYKGIVNHYHVTKRKIDCAGFNWNEILKNEKGLDV